MGRSSFPISPVISKGSGARQGPSARLRGVRQDRATEREHPVRARGAPLPRRLLRRVVAGGAAGREPRPAGPGRLHPEAGAEGPGPLAVLAFPTPPATTARRAAPVYSLHGEGATPRPHRAL